MALVVFLYQEKLVPNTVKNYLAAVRFAQIAPGLGDPPAWARCLAWIMWLRVSSKQLTGTKAPDNNEDLKAAEVGVAGLHRQEGHIPAMCSHYNVLLWFPQVWGGGGTKR